MADLPDTATSPRAQDLRAHEIRELARLHAELAIATLAEIAGDGDAKESARVLASKALLDRGFGAPERRVEQKVDVTIYDERQAHLTALQKLAERQAPKIEDHSVQDADWSLPDDKSEAARKL